MTTVDTTTTANPAEGPADDVARALRQAGISEVDNSSRRLAEYSTDASNYRVVPQVVVFPRDADEVEAAVRVARGHGVPLTARGAGTSIAGNAIGTGIVLDYSRHMNRIISLDPEAETAVVEPGVILDSLQAAARPHGLRFGPDPSTHARCTMGGMIGNNACGSRALAYGRTADNVVSMDVITSAGIKFTAARYGRDGLPGQTSGNSAGALLAQLSKLVDTNRALIRTEFGRFGRQVSGYSMEHLLSENGVDLARMLSGTEGTLAIMTSANVRLVRAPKATALAVLGYPDMAAAADVVPALLSHPLVALEGLDSRIVDVLRARRGEAAVPELPAGAGWLFAEVFGETQAEAEAAAAALCRDGDALGTRVVTGSTAAALWRIREDGAGLAGRSPAGAPAWPGWEDAAVPPEKLGTYLREFFSLLDHHGLDTLAYGHFGDGCVHARIDFPFETEPSRMREFMLEAADLVARHGGSMSGEHGDGRARGELLSKMYSPEAIALQAAVKDLFDPADLFNPGIIVRPAPLDADLRVPAAHRLRTNLAFSYPHDKGDFSTAVHRCVGVGKCRADTTGSGGVMCPSYLATQDEKDSTRGRARVLQEMANGTLVSGGWKSQEVHDALDLCLSCKGCSADCPAGVDMATYKAEALHQKYKGKLRPANHYLLGWLPRWADLASHAPRVVNALTGLAPVAAITKRVGGIDHRRELPRFAPKTFRQWFSRHKAPAGKRQRVVLWADTFTDHFSPAVGQAAVAVLEDAGLRVELPVGNACCGLTWISTGQLDGAKKQMRNTLDVLEEALDEGLTIVGLEPSCTAALRSDILELLPEDPRAPRLAASLKTLAELLTSLPDWKAPTLEGVSAVAQPHCHQHAVMGWQADADLLAGAGARVTSVGGCCGLAGNFGVEKGHYEVSVAVAENALLPAVREAADDTVVLADGFSCRTQLEQLADKQGLHLAELLAAHLPGRSLGSAAPSVTPTVPPTVAPTPAPAQTAATEATPVEKPVE
ncbi:oxidoreductase [Kineosporia sp. NBRC 101731]|nr:FAD-binding and (Fe-S)-binding domain-containing protein [Kineosporia sp. NBRC 101731]GLY31292.1 oxidoreductase [Kineosporia sp. NBRC 101731]